MDRLRFLVIACLGLLACQGVAQAQNLVSNGNFESGLTGWTVWSAPPGFWTDTWQHSNDCDIWVPTNGCPIEGAVSHAQKKGNDAPNAHGGLYQVISVEPGSHYQVDGSWSGGVTGNVAGNNATWWEVVVYDGVVDDSIIDAGVGAQDVLIAKREISNLANGEPFQFQWEDFSGTFTAQSSTATLVLKVGSFATFEAAGYHDDISVRDVSPVPVPILSPAWSLLLALSLSVIAGGVLWRR